MILVKLLVSSINLQMSLIVFSFSDTVQNGSTSKPIVLVILSSILNENLITVLQFLFANLNFTLKFGSLDHSFMISLLLTSSKENWYFCWLFHRRSGNLCDVNLARYKTPYNNNRRYTP